MSTWFLRIGRGEKRDPGSSHLLWSTQILVVLIALVVLGIAYGVWQVFQTGVPFFEGPDSTTLPTSGPAP